jgi:hypothetical protein
LSAETRWPKITAGDLGMKRLHLTAALVAALGTLALARPVDAQRRGAVRPGTRPGWFLVHIGPAFDLANNARVGTGWAALYLNEQLGVHFTGDASGPGLALDIRQGFAWRGYAAGAVNSNTFLFEVGGRFVYDIQLSPRAGVYLAPNVGVNFALARVYGDVIGIGFGDNVLGLAPQVALDLKIVIANRGLISIRPFGLDIPILFPRNSSDTLVFVNYDLAFGGGVIF